MVKRVAPGRGLERAAKPLREVLSEALPPQNLDAERAVLSSVLRDNGCLPEIVKLLKTDHFYGAAHQKVYEAVLHMFEMAVPIDLVTLGEELSRRQTGDVNWLKDVGGGPFLLELQEETISAANVMKHAQIVHDKAVLRNLIHTCTEILRDTYGSASSAEDILAEAEKRIFGILDARLTGDVQEIATVLSLAFDRISDRHNREGGAVGGVPSGFVDLDELTNGWQDSEIIILAARPSIGKTALALNFVEYAAVEAKHPVLFISLEMSQLELAERLLCSRAQINGHNLRRGRLGSDDMQKLIHAGEELSHAPIFIDDTPGQTMLRIAATARRLKLRHGLKMIVVDYLQLIEPEDRTVGRVEQIGTISRRLKFLARELKVPVIALSQLNRGVEAREGHKPRISDLRESGSIEQDADVVTLMHRPDAYDPQDSPGVVELIIAKQRNGPTGEVKLTFRKELTRFENFHSEIVPFDASGGEF